MSNFFNLFSNKKKKSHNDSKSQINKQPNLTIQMTKSNRTYVPTSTKEKPGDNSYLFYRKERKFLDNYIVIDFETTGLNPWEDSIIQIAAIYYERNIIKDEFKTYVNPERKISSRITQITGINNKTVKNAPTLHNALPQLLDFIGENVLIAHNASFDMKFLLTKIYQLNLPKINNKVIDTLQLSRRYNKDLKNHKLETIKEYFGLNLGSHNAYDDCLTCGQLYQFCKEKQDKIDESRPKKQKINEEDLIWYGVVQKILENNQKDLYMVRYGYTNKYFDIRAFYNFVRLKINGNKKYLLSKKKEKEIINLCPKAICEPAPKSESGETRIILHSPSDLLNLDKLIIEEYDNAIEEINYYRKNVAMAEEYIQEYLSS